MATKSSSGKSKSSWSNQVLKDLFEQRGIEVDLKKDTKLSGILRTDRNQLYRVKFDSKNEISILCPPENLLEKISDVLIGRQISGYFLGDDDFEEWFEDFSWEFRKNLPTTKQLPGTEVKPWGKDFEHRPNKKNLLSLEEVNLLGYQKIVFWEDRTLEDQSILLKGTYYELKRQLLDIMRGGVKQPEVQGERFYARRESVTIHPILTFYFSGKWTSTNYIKSLPTALHRIRLVDYVCHPDDSNHGKLITESDARKIAEKIIKNFAHTNFSFDKGFKTFTYKSRDLGDYTKVSTATEAEAINLISSILNVVNKKFDDKNFFESKVKNTARYTEKKKFNVMGREFQEATTKIIGKVFFRSATLKLDKIGYERVLCKVDGEKILSYDEVGV